MEDCFSDSVVHNYYMLINLFVYVILKLNDLSSDQGKIKIIRLLLSVHFVVVIIWLGCWSYALFTSTHMRWMISYLVGQLSSHGINLTVRIFLSPFSAQRLLNFVWCELYPMRTGFGYLDLISRSQLHLNYQSESCLFFLICVLIMSSDFVWLLHAWARPWCTKGVLLFTTLACTDWHDAKVEPVVAKTLTLAF